MIRFTSVLFLLAAAMLPAGPLFTIYRCASAPAIDGRLEDGCWQSAAAATPFVDARTGELPGEATDVRACWDGAKLYVGFRAREALLEPKLNMMHRVKAEKSGRDANVFGEDCVEVFLQPPGGGAYYHFAANSGAGTYEGRNRDAAWNGSWQCATRRGPGWYVVEMAIPFAALGAGPAGDWAVNFTRSRPQADELATWCGLRGGFHQPDRFGRLRFAADGPVFKAAQWKFTADRAELDGELLAAGAQPAVLTLIADFDGKISRTASRGLGRQRLVVPFPDSASGQGVARFLLRAGESPILESGPVAVRRSAAMARLWLGVRDVRVRAFCNGKVLTPARDGSCSLRLRPGKNVLAIEATARGSGPGLLPRLAAAGRPLFCRWAVRAVRPADSSWRTAMPSGDGWHRTPRISGLGAGIGPIRQFWSGRTARTCYAVTVLYVGDGGPQLFPKMDRFFLPRGSSQLLRVYLHRIPEVTAAGFRMIVEAPDTLEYRAMEPALCGVEATVTPIGRYRLGSTGMLRYAIEFPELPESGMELSMRWGDRQGNTLAYQPVLTAGGTTGWRHLRAVVTAPVDAVSAHPLVIKWQNRRITGTFWVDNVVFRAADSDVNLLKMGTFDEASWTRKFPSEGPDGSRCLKIVSTPARADRQQACWVDPKDTIPVTPGTKYVVELDVKCDRLIAAGSRPYFGLLFRGTEAMYARNEPLYTYFTAMDGLITEIPCRSTLRPLPPLRNARPERARIAPCYYGSRFSNPEVEKAYAENCWAAGMTWTYGKVSNGVARALLPRGLKVFLSIGWHAWSAPRGTEELLVRHPDWRAVDFKGKPMPRTVCPTLMLSCEGEAFFKALEISLLSILDHEPYAGANLDLEQPVSDPPSFCFCDRCLAAFRSFADLDAGAHLDAGTVMADYRDRWTRFRCGQNAEMAARLKMICGKARKPIEFSMYSGYQSTRTREHYGVDWGLLGPYLDFAIAGYGGGRKQIEDTVKALDGTPFMGGEMWYLSDRSDARPPPRMETWRNRLLRQYVQSGCHGCLIWYLPTMDGGAFYATSEATELIATWEDYFRAEQRCDSEVAVRGLPATDWAAFRRGDSVLVLLLNFSAKPIEAVVAVGGRSGRRAVPPYGAEVAIMKQREK